MRTIVVEQRVAGTPEEIFDMWTSQEGVRQFFAPDAVIEPRAGGEYTIVFSPEHDPQGLSHGTKGAHILTFERGRRLAFEWTAFTTRELDDVPGPPAAPELRNRMTRVDVTFAPDGAGHTLVRLEHGGFESGAPWNASHAFFSRVWPMVLENLEKARGR